MMKLCTWCGTVMNLRKQVYTCPTCDQAHCDCYHCRRARAKS